MRWSAATGHLIGSAVRPVGEARRVRARVDEKKWPRKAIISQTSTRILAGLYPTSSARCAISASTSRIAFRKANRCAQRKRRRAPFKMGRLL